MTTATTRVREEDLARAAERHRVLHGDAVGRDPVVPRPGRWRALLARATRSTGAAATAVAAARPATPAPALAEAARNAVASLGDPAPGPDAPGIAEAPAT